MFADNSHQRGAAADYNSQKAADGAALLCATHDTPIAAAAPQSKVYLAEERVRANRTHIKSVDLH